MSLSVIEQLSFHFHICIDSAEKALSVVEVLKIKGLPPVVRVKGQDPIILQDLPEAEQDRLFNEAILHYSNLAIDLTTDNNIRSIYEKTQYLFRDVFSPTVENSS